MDNIVSYLAKNRERIESQDITKEDMLEFLDLIAEVDTVLYGSMMDDIEELYKRLLMYILFTGTNQVYVEMYVKLQMIAEKVNDYYYSNPDYSYYLSKVDLKEIFDYAYYEVKSLMSSLYIRPRLDNVDFIDISELIDKDKLTIILKKYASNRDIISDLGLLDKDAYDVWVQ